MRCGGGLGRVVDAALVKRHLAGRQTLIFALQPPTEGQLSVGGAVISGGLRGGVMVKVKFGKFKGD